MKLGNNLRKTEIHCDLNREQWDFYGHGWKGSVTQIYQLLWQQWKILSKKAKLAVILNRIDKLHNCSVWKYRPLLVKPLSLNYNRQLWNPDMEFGPKKKFKQVAQFHFQGIFRFTLFQARSQDIYFFLGGGGQVRDLKKRTFWTQKVDFLNLAP